MARGYLKDLKQWWFFEDFTFLRENESKQAKRSNVSFRHDCIRNFAARLCNITGMSAAWRSGNRGCKGEIYSTALRHTTARFYSIRMASRTRVRATHTHVYYAREHKRRCGADMTIHIAINCRKTPQLRNCREWMSWHDCTFDRSEFIIAIAAAVAAAAARETSLITRYRNGLW